MKFENLRKTFRRPPTLETPRLFLRKMKVTDAKDMFEYACREDVTRYLLWSPHPGLEHTREYLSFVQNEYREGNFYDWAIVLKEREKMIGTCGFASVDLPNNSAEIGYVVNPAYHNFGFATEAVLSVLEFGFLEMGLHRIEARFIVGNKATRRVMEKCGMRFEGIRRGSAFVKGSYVDVGSYAILKNEYIRMVEKGPV